MNLRNPLVPEIFCTLMLSINIIFTLNQVLNDSLVAMNVINNDQNRGMKLAILRRLGRYQEAAKYNEEDYEYYKKIYDYKKYGYPTTIAHNLTVNYQTFRLAHQNDKALEAGDELCSIVDSVINHLKKDNAAKLATIYDTKGKEQQIAEQEAELSQNRWERIESELRIARDIQMSMVPGVFPERDGLDMFASMTPAKEVGGDLYGYVLEGDRLYFCVGDVSGKGVPASLFIC